MPPWGESLGFGFRPYWDQPMYVKDQDGNLVPIQRPIPEAPSLPDQQEHDHLPSLEDQSASFTISGKTAKRIIRMIEKDLARERRKKRRMVRKKEAYRRACLKYPQDSRGRYRAYMNFAKAHIEYYLGRWRNNGQG